MPNVVTRDEQGRTLKSYLDELAKKDSKKAFEVTWSIAQHTPLDKRVGYLSTTLQILRRQQAALSQSIDPLVQKLNEVSEKLKQLAKLEKQKKYDEAEALEDEIKASIKLAHEFLKNQSVPLDDSHRIEWSEAVSKLCQSEIGDTGKSTSIYDKPLMRVNNPGKSKLGLRDQLSPDMNDYLFVKDKSQGYNKPGTFGGEYIGCYLDEDNNLKVQRILFKQDTSTSRVTRNTHIHHDKNIIEVVAARIMNEFMGDSAASIFFATAPGVDARTAKDGSGKDIYVASIFYDNFNDLYKQMYKLMGLPIPRNRPARLHMPWPFVENNFTEVFKKTFIAPDGTKCRFDNFPEILGPSVLVADFDFHTANLGVVKEEIDGVVHYKLVRIDMGGALKNVDGDDGDDLHMHSHWRHPPNLVFFGGATNHFREYPRQHRVSLEFADELERIGYHDPKRLNKVINDVIDEVAHHYGPEPLVMFFKRMGVKVDDVICHDKHALIEKAKQFLIDKMAARQVDCLKLALEMKISLALNLDKNGKVIPNKELDAAIRDLDKLIHLHQPRYQKYLTHTADRYHLRRQDQSSQWVRGGKRYVKSEFLNPLFEYAKTVLATPVERQTSRITGQSGDRAEPFIYEEANLIATELSKRITVTQNEWRHDWSDKTTKPSDITFRDKKGHSFVIERETCQVKTEAQEDATLIKSLRAFELTHPGELPKITVEGNENNKAVQAVKSNWITAIKVVYPNQFSEDQLQQMVQIVPEVAVKPQPQPSLSQHEPVRSQQGMRGG